MLYILYDCTMYIHSYSSDYAVYRSIFGTMSNYALLNNCIMLICTVHAGRRKHIIVQYVQNVNRRGVRRIFFGGKKGAGVP